MNYVTSDTELTAVANAIRAKTGGTAEIEYPTEYVSEIGTLHSNGEVDTLHGAILNKVSPSRPNLWDSTNERAPVEIGKHYKATLTWTPEATDDYVQFVAYYSDASGMGYERDDHFLIEEFPAGTYDGQTAHDFTYSIPDISSETVSEAPSGTQFYLMFGGMPASAIDVREEGPRTASEWLGAVNNDLVRVNPATGVDF